MFKICLVLEYFFIEWIDIDELIMFEKIEFFFGNWVCCFKMLKGIVNGVLDILIEWFDVIFFVDFLMVCVVGWCDDLFGK